MTHLSAADLVPKTLTGVMSILSSLTLAIMSWLCIMVIGMKQDIAVLKEQNKAVGTVPVSWQIQVESAQKGVAMLQEKTDMLVEKLHKMELEAVRRGVANVP